MPDKEIVINGLDCCAYSHVECSCPSICPYHECKDCIATLLHDAATLLKAQNAEKAEKDKIPEYPCKKCCSPSEQAACCGCEKERQWRAKYGKKSIKDSKPKPVKITRNAYGHKFYKCPNCDREFYNYYEKPNFCEKCGQAVAWNES